MGIVLNFFELISQFFEKIFGQPNSFLVIMPIAIILKFSIVTFLIIKFAKTSKKTLRSQLIFLIIAIFGLIFSDLAWFVKMLNEQFNIGYTPVAFFVRIAWGFSLVQYQSLSLFLESLTYPTLPRPNFRQLFFSIVSALFLIYFVATAFLNIGCQSPYTRFALEYNIQSAAALCSLLVVIPITLFFLFKYLKTAPVPRLLRKQIRTFLTILIIPWLLCDLLQAFPFNFSPGFIAGSYAMATISTLLITAAIYFSIRKILGLRFLNLKKQVQAAQQVYTYTFIDNFKNVLEQLSFATTLTELGHITQAYFKNCFDIPIKRITIYSRKYDAIHELDPQSVLKKSLQPEEPLSEDETKVQELIEDFLSTADSSVHAYLLQSKIIVHDEIAFNTFYENNPAEHKVLLLMQEINADIWLPIFDKQKMVAYVIIDRYSRGTDSFYSNIEHDEMVVFANYLANIIHLLQNRNLDNLIQQEKELKEEIYNKHQEINQYKESMRSFLRTSSQKKIGIIFYKGRRFIFANQSAQELIQINPNQQPSHPLSMALKKVATRVLEYKTPQTHIVNDAEGNKIVISGVPNLEGSNVIITVHHPELSDILASQISNLKDPSKWDYLLYLETTSSGQLINQLIPSNSETFLNFKIELLKTGLSKKALLLDMPAEDLMSTVELIHHISLRENLYTLNLTSHEKNIELATKLFGINHLFALEDLESGEPLFRRLHNTGTLYIKNIHFLSAETQDYLTEYLRYGYYRIFKSEQKIAASVRIVCSSNQDLTSLTHKKKFSRELLTELRKTALIMPSLLTVADGELTTLADGFTEQALQDKTYKNLIELNTKEKEKLITQRPVSLKELRNMVQQQLISKSKQEKVYEEIQFDPAYELTDPALIAAARLGKHALKDPRVLSLLWNKFGNQTKIAALLNVNRSSINRRLKKYNLF